MPVSVWLSCALISCAFYIRTTSAECSQQTDCFEKEICCNGRCIQEASCVRGSCSTDEHCDTLRGERCEQGRCTSTEASTTAASAQGIKPTSLRCKNAQDCGTYFYNVNASCCNGVCTQEPSCTERCSNNEQCDTTKGERCIRSRCVAGMNVVCDDDFDCRAGETCDRSRQCVPKEFDKGRLWSKEKITGIIVFVVVGFAVTIIYAMCKKSRRRRRSSSQGPAAATSTTAEFVVIDMERPVPFSPDAPPAYDSLTFSSNQRNQEQEPAPPSYDEAVRNSTNNLNLA